MLGAKIPNLIPSCFEGFFIPNPALTSHVLFAASSSSPSPWPWNFGIKVRENREFCGGIMRHRGNCSELFIPLEKFPVLYWFSIAFEWLIFHQIPASLFPIQTDLDPNGFLWMSSTLRSCFSKESWVCFFFYPGKVTWGRYSVFPSCGHLQWIPCFPKASPKGMALLGSLECSDLNLDHLSPEVLEFKHFYSLSRAFPEAPARSTQQGQHYPKDSNF